MFDGKKVLITGGTGSLGTALTKKLLETNVDTVRIFSRDEWKQVKMQSEIIDKRLRFFIGDVRDKERLSRALEDIDIVIHTAALKQVPVVEYNPFEAVKTNVLGTENLIEACLDKNVETVLGVGTDKAVSPLNTYGATKLLMERLFITANFYRGNHKIKFLTVRYGNVLGSRGSIVPTFINQIQNGKKITITDPEMTRFNISLEEGVGMVLWALEHALGGELFVPKIPSYRIIDVAEAIGPGCEKPITGIRPGEKIHEEMITSSDSFTTVDFGKYYAILPSDGRLLNHYQQAGTSLKSVQKGFAYNSGTNPEFLSVERLRELIREHVDPAFKPV